MNVSGNHVVVTGGGTDVGTETTRQFFEADVLVAIMGRTAESLIKQDPPYQACDITDPETVKAAIAPARSVNGHTLTLSGGEM